MTEVFYYKIFCNTENTFVYKWETDTPTTCPNNNTHTIDVDTITVETSVNENEVIINEEIAKKTQGFFKIVDFSFDALPNQISNHDFSYPIRTAVLNIQIATDDNQKDDIMSCVLAPNTTVGVITAELATGNNVLNVSQTVLDNIKVGFNANITNGVNNNDLGLVVEVNKPNGTITVENNTTNTYAIGSFVQMSVYYMDSWVIGRGFVYSFGENKIGASAAEANTILRVIYDNKTGDTKKIRLALEILY